MNARWIIGALVAVGITSAAIAQSRVVYRCELDGQLVFSDRHCAPGADVHSFEPAPVNMYEAPAQAASAPRKKSEPTGDDSTVNSDADKNKQTCERFALRLREVRSKLRAGYKPSQGEKLKARYEQLKAQMRIARCG